MIFLCFLLTLGVVLGVIWWLGAVFIWLYFAVLLFGALGCWVYEKTR